MKNSRATFGHTGLVLNGQYSAANPPVLDRTKVQDCIGVDRLVIRPQYRDLKEPLHLAQGGTAGRVHKGMLSMQAQGRILVPNATQAASMEDQEKALRLAFDPYECYRDSPTTDGVYPLSWLEPTLDTTNYASGWMPVTRYVRPVAQPETEWSITDQSYRSWAVGLVAPDPRLYDTTLGSAYYGGGGTTVVNKGTASGPLRVTLNMSAAGNPAFSVAQYGPNLLLNPGFEYGNGSVADNWSGATLYNNTVHSGAYSATTTGPGPKYVVSNSFPVVAGRAYNGGVWARGNSGPNSTTTQCDIRMSFFDATGAKVGSDATLGTLVVGQNNAWQNVAGTATAPATAVSAYFFLVHINTGYADIIYYDDAQIVESNAFVLNLSGRTTGDVVRVVMETCGPFGAGKSVTVNGVPAFALKLSGPTSWLDAPTGASVFLINDATGIASILYEWGHARP